MTESPSSKHRLRRACAIATGVIVVIAAVHSIVPQTAQSLASASEYVSVYQKVRTLHAGKRVHVSPPWRVDAAMALHQEFPDDNIAFAMNPRSTDSLANALLLVDARVDRLPSAIDAHAKIEHHGAIDVVTFSGSAVSSSVIRNVRIDNDDGTTQRCTKDAAGTFRCDKSAEWMYVGDTTQQIGGRSERCTWAHPKNNASVVIDLEYSTDPALRFAFSDAAATNASGAPVRVQIDAMREQVSTETTEFVIAPRRGFQNVTPKFTKPHDVVRLTLRTENDGQRHLCFRIDEKKP